MQSVAKLVTIPLVAMALLCGSVGAEEPADIVRQLYDNHPTESYPPGGLERWAPSMQALWLQLAEEELQRQEGKLEWMGEGLTFDFMIGNQEGYWTDVKIKTIVQVSHEASVRASVGMGDDAPYVLNYGFVRDEVDGWQIMEVWIGGQDGEQLSDLIKATR